MKTRVDQRKMFCDVLKKAVCLNVEQTFVPAGLGQQGGEWVDGSKDCSNCEACYSQKIIDCKWVVGTNHSQRDPLVEDIVEYKTISLLSSKG